MAKWYVQHSPWGKKVRHKKGEIKNEKQRDEKEVNKERTKKASTCMKINNVCVCLCLFFPANMFTKYSQTHTHVRSVSIESNNFCSHGMMEGKGGGYGSFVLE